VLRAASGNPVVYLHGAGALYPGLERELESHRVGDIVSARLLPDGAFGQRNVDLLHTLPLSELPPGDKIEVAGYITGNDEDGNKITFAVTGIENGITSLDGNHPLAGQTLVFEIVIQGIRDATAEEILEGKSQSQLTTSPSGNGYPGS